MIYGSLVVVLNESHMDPIVIMGNIVLVILNKSHMHSFQLFMQLLLEFLMRCFLELLEFGSRKNLPITNNIVKGIIAIALIGHDQDKACSKTN
jgi:hypothetical protein